MARMCDMIASGETPYVAPVKKPKTKDREDGAEVGTSAAAEPVQTSTFQYTVRWTAQMKQQLLKVDLCTLRWVESENRRRKVMTVDDKRKRDSIPHALRSFPL